MKFTKIALILLFLIVSIGAVSATEEINNETISADNPIEMGDVALNDEPTILQNTGYSEYGESEINNTFTDLANDISASAEVFEIEKNYKFNNDSDDAKKINIAKDDFVINGNNHIIDANGQASVFFIQGKNVTINNLKLVNGHFGGAGGAIAVEAGSLTLNNVTFSNNAANFGGDVAIVENAQVNIFNCNFIDSYSSHGSAFYLETGTLNIEYSNFTSKNFSHWGSILLIKGAMNYLLKIVFSIIFPQHILPQYFLKIAM